MASMAAWCLALIAFGGVDLPLASPPPPPQMVLHISTGYSGRGVPNPIEAGTFSSLQRYLPMKASPPTPLMSKLNNPTSGFDFLLPTIELN